MISDITHQIFSSLPTHLYHTKKNDFFQALPRDMLFLLKTENHVRSLNKELGGTSLDRFSINMKASIRGLRTNNSREKKGFSLTDALVDLLGYIGVM
jgi:hypothetical protein